MPPGSCVCSYWFSPSPFAAPRKPGCLLPPSWQRASCLQTRPMLSLLFFQIPRASPALSSASPSSFPGAAPLHPAPPPASLLSKVIILSLWQAFSPLCALGFLHSWTPPIIPVHHPFCVLVLLPGRFLLVPSPTLTWLLSPRVISPPARSCARCPQLLGVLRLPLRSPHRHRPKEMASLPAPRLFPLLWVALRWGPPARTCPLMSASGLQSQGTHVNRHGGRPPSARPDSAWVSSAALRGPHCWLCLLLAPSREQVVTELAQNSCLESVRATQHVSPSDRSGQSRQEGEKAPEPGPRATHEGRVSGRGDRAPTQLPGHRASGKRPGAQQAPRAVR